MSVAGDLHTLKEMLDEHVREETGRAMVVDRERLHEILDELLYLKEISDPWACADPDSIRVDLNQGKYAMALYAKILSAFLIKATAGWGFCHVIGAKALDATSSATKNSHACERSGALGISEDEPSTLRKALVAAVGGCEGAMPQWAEKRPDLIAQGPRSRRSSPTDDADQDKTPWPTVRPATGSI